MKKFQLIIIASTFLLIIRTDVYTQFRYLIYEFLWILSVFVYTNTSNILSCTVCIKCILIILLLYKPFCFTIKYAFIWDIHCMLIFLDNFFSFFTVCLILMNLLLESSEHSFFGLGCFFFCCLDIIHFFFWLLVFLEFRSELAYETSKLIISFTWFFRFIRWWGCLRGSRIFILHFIDHLRILGNLTIRRALFFLFGRFLLFLRFLCWLIFRFFYSCCISRRCNNFFCRFFFLLFFERFIQSCCHFILSGSYCLNFLLRLIFDFIFLQLNGCFLFGNLISVLNHFRKWAITFVLILIFRLFASYFLDLCIVSLRINCFRSSWTSHPHIFESLIRIIKVIASLR